LDSVNQLNTDLKNLTIKSNNQFEVLKEENVLLRKIMKGYVIEIDKLVTLNRDLEEDLEEAKKKISEKESSSEKVKSTTSNNRTNPAANYNNPFGDGGTGSGQGNGEGSGFGSDSGSGSRSRSRPGTGIGNDHGRVRLNNVNVENITVAKDATINYQLTVDANGNVVAFSLAGIRDMSLDEALINKVGTAIKKQVKYNRAKGSPLVYQYYTIHIKVE
jgi:hypothetical protein